MRPRLFLLALIVVAAAFPTGAAACSFVLQCEARHSTYDPLAQRAQPITIPFDSMCQSDPPPTAHEIRALASGAPNSADDSYDTAGVALAEKVVSAQLRILAAPDQKPRRRCQPEADCESARAHEVAGLHMSVAGLRLKLFAMTGERRWLDKALAEANLATRSNVHGYQSYGFDLTETLSADISATYYTYPGDTGSNAIELGGSLEAAHGPLTASLGISVAPPQSGTRDDLGRRRANVYAFSGAGYRLSRLPVSLRAASERWLSRWNDWKD